MDNFFYKLNDKLNSIRATPETTHKQLNERDEGKPGKNFEKIAKDAAKRYGSMAAGERVAGAVRAKLAKQGKLEEESMTDDKTAAQQALQALGQGNNQDMIKDLQRRAGVPQTGKVQPGQQPMSEDDVEEGNRFTGNLMKARAAGKKQADLDGDGDMEPVREAAKPDYIDLDNDGNKKETMRQAAADRARSLKAPEAKVSRHSTLKKVSDPKSGLSGYVPNDKQEVEEGWDDMLKAADERRREGMRSGEKTQGHKGEIEKTATGIKHTRRYDAKTGETDSDDDEKPAGEKRGRGRPKKTDKAPERVTAKAYKHKGERKVTKEGSGMKHTFAILDDTLIDQIARMNGAEVDPDAGSVETYDENTARQLADFAKKNPQRLKQTQSINTAGMRPMAQAVGGTASGPDYNLKEEDNDVKAAMKLLKKAGYKVTKGHEELDEKAVSKAQQRFMGMAHAMQKGEKIKGASPELKKVAKTMKKGDVEDYATTKHKGLPEKKKAEEVEETTVAGSVAPSAAAPKSKSKGGMTFGKGIYDSMNREVEGMIAESMDVSVNMSMDETGTPRKNITISAQGEAAEQLAQLLNLAGMSTSSHKETCPTCGSADCGCQELDENQPDWPTNTEYTSMKQSTDPVSNDLNKNKDTGQTVGAPFNRQDSRQGVMDEAARVAEESVKVEESVDELTKLWKTYKG